jgi:protein SMG8
MCGAGSARIADRILDAHAFSLGGSVRTLAGGVRYHRDGNKRLVFLHLTPLKWDGWCSGTSHR